MKVLSKLFNRPRHRESPISLGHLTRMVRRYTVEQQQVPKDLLDLVARKYLGSIPCAPRGKKFVIDRKKVEVRLEQLKSLVTGE